jgi:hypothetical protein
MIEILERPFAEKRIVFKIKFDTIVVYSEVFAGVYSSEATPVPIPNTEVKLTCGDGIAGLSLWESSTMPALFSLTRFISMNRVFLCLRHNPI